MKIKGRLKKELLEISNLIPDTYLESKSYYVDYLEDNFDNEIMNNNHGQGFEIVKRETAVFSKKVYHKVNHFKRLKKAFKKNGVKGIEDYINWVGYNNKKMNAEHQMKLSMITASQILKHKIQRFF